MIRSRASVVLVRPIYPRNIGSTARAMANMGLERLILIAPQCEITESAREGAAGAQGPLQNLMTYRNWDDFFANEGEGVRFGLSRRQGRVRPVSRLDDQLEALEHSEVRQLADMSVPLYFIFGPEDDGLNAEDLEFVHHICELPIFGEFKSLNLAHAVLLTLYIVQSHFERKASRNETGSARLRVSESHETESPSFNLQPAYYPSQTIENWLTTLGFDLSNQRVNASRILNRILLENTPTPKELRVLESILQQTIRKLRESRDGST